MTYFLSPALVRLRGEINTLWPGRDRSSDGWIGDTSHQARASDHNPDYSAGGIVRAIDVDKDGIPAQSVVDQVIRDSRVAYVIWNGRIWENPAVYAGRGYWRAYTGANAHRQHFHVSVRRGRAWDHDARTWGITASTSSTGSTLGPLPTVPDLTPIAPIEEDEMSAAGEAAILAALSNIESILAREGGNGLRGDVQTAIARATEARDWTGTVANELRAGLVTLGQAIRAGGPVAVDAAGIAAALAESLGDDLARQVADELADRLSRA